MLVYRFSGIMVTILGVLFLLQGLVCIGVCIYVAFIFLFCYVGTNSYEDSQENY